MYSYSTIVYVIPTLRRISLELVTFGNHFTVVINLAGGIRCANAKLTRSFIGRRVLIQKRHWMVRTGFITARFQPIARVN